MKPIFTHETNWKGTMFVEEFYDNPDFTNITPITQVQAIPFIDKNHIAVFEHIDGYFSLPGGKVEQGEDLISALERECIEEMQAKILKTYPIGYFKNWKKSNPETVNFNARYISYVELLDKPIDDPAKKAIGRKVVTIDSIVETLGWGDKAEVLIRTALKHLPNLKLKSL